MLLSRRRRRGIVAVTLAFALMLLLFAGLSAFLLALTASGVRIDSSHAEAQALYAAEAGIDIALQTRQAGTFTGMVGRGQYAVRVGDGTIVALGQITRAAGTSTRAAVAVDVAGGSIVHGTWRQVPPGQQTDLVALLQPGTATETAASGGSGSDMPVR